MTERNNASIVFAAVSYTWPHMCSFRRDIGNRNWPHELERPRPQGPDSLCPGAFVGLAGAIYQMVVDSCSGGICWESGMSDPKIDDQSLAGLKLSLPHFRSAAQLAPGLPWCPSCGVRTKITPK